MEELLVTLAKEVPVPVFLLIVALVLLPCIAKIVLYCFGFILTLIAMISKRSGSFNFWGATWSNDTSKDLKNDLEKPGENQQGQQKGKIIPFSIGKSDSKQNNATGDK